MKKVIVFILMLFTPFIVFAADIKTNMIKNWSGNSYDYFYSIASTNDNGFIIVGETNPRGMPYKAMYDALSFKYDSEGNLLWSKSFGGTNYEYFNSVISTDDEGYVVVGHTYSTNIEGFNITGVPDAFIIKYDKDGNVIWKSNFGGSSEENFYDVINTNDGFVAVGYSYSTDIENMENKGSKDAIIVKFDNDGNIIWKSNFGGNDVDEFTKVALADNEEIVVIGNSKSTNIDGIINKGSIDAIIVKYNKDGNIIWKNNWGGNDEDKFINVIQTDDLGFVVSGYFKSNDIENINNNGSIDAAVIKYDKDGNFLWNNRFGGNLNDEFNYISETKDNGFILYGSSSSSNLDQIELNGDSDVLITKYDKNGNFLWTKNWGGSGSENLIDVLRLSDDEFVFLVESNSTDIDGLSDKGSSNMMFVKAVLEYNLNAETTTNGTSVIEQNGKYGIIKPVAEKGFEVEEIIVKDKSGNIVDIEVIPNDDGTYSIELIDDFDIEVVFKSSIDNPKTGVKDAIMFVPAIIFMFMCFYFIKRCEKSYEI